ncbi:SpaH/EbpB family LPXTG-anchored major pilin [Bifidobacterium longum]|uniref:Fimbrial subunit FimA n=1 Tax=Bifidobacterium longum subsp. suis TaxID=1695 RepID=A0A087BQ77_BIFLN|nr:SpaH/EbpB family LPXTG-anchored major pilin [Bifidobacterium longum]KFI73177.1 fimbrial subunit FimA [Bifidobacterium longum subsp. suis]UNU70207.1 SpaH/EbpB family LPXTG-anchored major pilin [Bifidobacterium longum]SDO31656.1 LPXTG-motif cell wall anchor domain-containing protein/fimbrial isopeptide formation D2 domain-containing protein [Bifidobacterium longum]
MKSLIRKVAAGVLAAATMLGIAGLGATTASARTAKTATLTVTSSDAAFNGKTVKAYQMFSASPDAAGQNATYTLAYPWGNFFKTNADDLGITGVTDDNVSEKAYDYVYGLNQQDMKLAEFATKASNWAKKNNVSVSATATAEASGNAYVATFEYLPLGYYVVSPQAGSTSNTRHTDAMLVNVTATKNINLKSEYPTVDKTIDTDKKGDSAQIGSKVNFQLKSKVPDTSEYTNYVFKIVDTLSAGLDFNNDVTVKVGDATLSTTTHDYSVTTSGKIVTIDLSNYVKTDNASKAGKGILVTYSATLNKDAFVGTPGQDNPGNLNSAKVQYSNDPSADSIGESTASETHSYTFNFNLKKIYKEGDIEHTLAYARFQLLDSNKTSVISLVKKSENVYRPATDGDTDTVTVTEVETPANGMIEFTGLKAGTYYLKETDAPAGYNKLSDPVEVTIEATINKTTGALESWKVNGSAPTTDVPVPVVKIENKKGALLPDTGGMGTVLFTVFGVLIVALGAGWYVKSNRKSRHAA